MNRRGFLSFLATGTVIGAVAPSQVWPFKKIFLPAMQPTPRATDWLFYDLEYIVRDGLFLKSGTSIKKFTAHGGWIIAEFM